jgi:hypothetical protein
MSDFLDGLAGELTGSAGMPDAPSNDDALPNELADQVEAFDAHQAERSEGDDDQGDDHDGRTRTPKQVPLGALQEERQRRQQLAADLERERQNNLALQAQFNAALQAQQQALQAQPQQPQIPDFADDPEGHVRALAEQFQQQLADLQQGQQQQQFSDQLRQESAQLGASIAESEASFRQQVGAESYDQAFAAVDQHVQAQIAAMHPGATQDQLAVAKTAASVAFVKQCQHQGINPAEHIWQFAQELGFTPGQRVPAQVRPKPPTSLGSLAGASGPDETGKLTADKVANMSDAEFEKLCKDMRSSSRQGPRI